MWCVELWSNGGLVMCPEAWLKRGFWENYFDRKQAAIHLFNKVTAELELEDSVPSWLFVSNFFGIVLFPELAS